ncbi:MAG: hypothetical protein HC919_13835 [Oscillatoriales cyanobacterium SM2_2_1]|nr:hypothetical protein [Oscillatoriales cyanobacterium SM2_2_1]
MILKNLKELAIASGVAALSLWVSPSAEALTTLNITNPGGAIPSGGGFTDFSFNVSAPVGEFTTDVNLFIDSLTHPSDLSNYEIYLRDPSGTALVLTLAELISGTSFADVTFDDSATTVLPGSGPYTGAYRPQGGSGGFGEVSNIASLAGFNGISPNGLWNLRIYNFDPALDGALSPGGTDVTLTVTTAVPFEFSPVGGVALLGAIWAVRKFRKRS